MTKKLTAVERKFSKAAKQIRAAEREARETAKAEREKMLDESIVPVDVWSDVGSKEWKPAKFAQWDGEIIAYLCPVEDGTKLQIFMGCIGDLVIRNVDACKPLLTFRKLCGARRVHGGIDNLANLVRQRDAEASAQAEAEQIRAACGSQPAASKAPQQKTRL